MAPVLMVFVNRFLKIETTLLIIIFLKRVRLLNWQTGVADKPRIKEGLDGCVATTQ